MRGLKLSLAAAGGTVLLACGGPRLYEPAPAPGSVEPEPIVEPDPEPEPDVNPCLPAITVRQTGFVTVGLEDTFATECNVCHGAGTADGAFRNWGPSDGDWFTAVESLLDRKDAGKNVASDTLLYTDLDPGNASHTPRPAVQASYVTWFDQNQVT